MYNDFSIQKLEEIDSTNSYTLRIADKLPHHSVIISDIQTEGKGNRGREWDSSIHGNLYMTLLEKPIPQKKDGQFSSVWIPSWIPSPDINSLTPTLASQNFVQLLAVCAVATCRGLGVEAGIKWPNDIFVGNRKLGGLLGQVRISGGKWAEFVIGLGLNIVAAPRLNESPYQAISMYDLVGSEIDTSISNKISDHINRNVIVDSILQNYSEKYNNFIQQGFPFIKKEYEQYLIRSNLFRYVDGIIYQVDGVNDHGELLGSPVDSEENKLKRGYLGYQSAILDTNVDWVW